VDVGSIPAEASSFSAVRTQALPIQSPVGRQKFGMGLGGKRAGC
jgi:hypothetical protein